MNDTPDWYDESKAVRAVFAFEDERATYGGWVIDLGDGTCRLANKPLLGDVDLKWGDRVDLYYPPCDPFSRPWIGYRVYPENSTVPGENLSKRRDPTEEEIEARKKKQQRNEEFQFSSNLKLLEAQSDLAMARIEASKHAIRYYELKSWVEEQGLSVPDDLHVQESPPVKESDEERRDMKLFLMATARARYGDVEISDAEVEAEAETIKLNL